jgi:predicted peptidase
MRAAVALLVIVVLFQNSPAAPTTRPAPTTQVASFRKTITKTLDLDYLVFLPASYHQGKSPLLIFLHGSGACGHDVRALSGIGPIVFANAHPDFPFVIIAPQSHSEKEWWQVESLDALLAEVLAKYDVDPDRVYLTGASMGGYGVWDWASHSPQRFAAIAPLCGEGNDDLAEELKHVPVWAFHGAKDLAVSPAEEERMVKAVNLKGGCAKLTMYPDLGHNVWTRTYQLPELYEFFLQHTRWTPPPATEPKP